MTFSRSLAGYLARTYGYEVATARIRLGGELGKGEESSPGLYALVSRKRGTILRVSTIREFAEETCDYDSRMLCECSVISLEKVPNRG